MTIINMNRIKLLRKLCAVYTYSSIYNNMIVHDLEYKNL